MRLPIVCFLILFATASFAETWRETAINDALAEPKVHSAQWSQEESFWIAVDDDGTRRDGFAEYTCLVLALAGKPQGEIIIVTVLDHNSMLQGNFKELGKKACR
ncbi:hypothetical protein [Maritalea porphyrae]|uniref:hypothetical protein n=1 Tax=Maritalea porphyrae TaxID=880732 RepID=UPI0022AE7969|nr:hypothetical protein [Maritalea porphyrae]MCZ4273323.1 hypothetical protein [Maritalea porphyrae]